MSLKKLFATTLLTLLLFTPLTTNALTVPEMQELIAKLTAQVQLLVQQLTDVQNNNKRDIKVKAATPQFCGNLSTLRFGIGHQHGEVINLQKFLKQTGDFTYGEFTTYYGNQTKQAVQRYQCREMSLCSGTPSTNGYGLAGPGTRKHMCASRTSEEVVPPAVVAKTCNAPPSSAQGPLQDGASRVFYDVSSLLLSGDVHDRCDTHAQKRVCINGILSGDASYQYDTCQESGAVSYTWHTTGWSVCANGIQTRVTSCRGADGRTYANSMCAKAKPTTQRSCTVRTTVTPWLHTFLGLSAGQYPFSFLYNGDESTEILSQWDVQESTRHGARGVIEYTTVYSDPNSDLVLTVVTTKYDANSAAWVLKLKNTGSADTPIIDSLLPLDASLSSIQPSMRQLQYSNGGHSEEDAFELQSESLSAKKVLEVVTGRSSDSVLPFFNVYDHRQGLMFGLGWSGSWRAVFDPHASQVSLGMRDTHFYLRPGEEVRSPSVLVLKWSGSSSQIGQNTLRQFILEKVLPGPALSPPVSVSDWAKGGFQDRSSADVAQSLTTLRQHPLDVDAYWQDAGWFGNPEWNGVGTWRGHPLRFPNGIQEYAQHVRNAGLKFLLWFEPERVTLGSEIANQYPQWLLESPEQSFVGSNRTMQRLFDMGNPAALAWAKNFYGNKIRDLQLGVFRMDFNENPAPYWKAADAPNRVGIHEMKHIAGLYSFLDYVRTTYPHALIDNSASGGRRVDFEMLKRSISLIPVDGRLSDSKRQQNVRYGLSNWIPIYGGQTTNAVNTYSLRSLLAPTMDVVMELRNGYNAESWEKTKDIIFLTRLLQPLYFGDYYPLSGTSPASAQTLAMQYNRSDLGAGFVLVFGRGSAVPSAPALRGLHGNTVYSIIDIDNPVTVYEKFGHDLMSNGLNIGASTEKARIFLYQESESRTDLIKRYRDKYVPQPQMSPPTCLISASEKNINLGESTLISVAVTNATKVTLDNRSVGVGADGSGTPRWGVKPAQTTTYRAQVEGPGGTNTCAIQIGVTRGGTSQSVPANDQLASVLEAIKSLLKHWR
jgi:alpha-galactosidase